MSVIEQQHLFESEQDIRDRRRELRQHRASRQARCPGCGRFAQYPQDYAYDSICLRCLDDPRPAIVEKVKQVKHWWEMVKR